MPILIRDKRALRTRLDERAAHQQTADGPPPVHIQAMAAASRIFAAASDARALPSVAATELAGEPGQMCLVSLASRESDSLRPVAVAHERPTESRMLHRIVAIRSQTPADAFSRAVFRSGGALRMAIASPRLLRLWLPKVYWPFVERTGVSGVLAAALRDQDQVRGTLFLWRERDQPAFDELDQAYVNSLAARLALGLARHPLVA